MTDGTFTKLINRLKSDDGKAKLNAFLGVDDQDSTDRANDALGD